MRLVDMEIPPFRGFFVVSPIGTHVHFYVKSTHDPDEPTFLCIGGWDNEAEAKNVISYMNTKFFHLLMFLKKVSHHVTAKVSSFVPMQDFSKPWTDAELYEKYGLDENEINFIESMIKPMELPAETKNG